MTGCNSAKRIQRTQEHNTTQTETQIGIEQTALVITASELEQEEHIESSGILEVEETTEEVRETVKETFDTAKPVDPDTGTPPLESRTKETTITNKTVKTTYADQESTEKKTTAKTDIREEVETSVTILDTENSESTVDTEITEEKGQEAAKRPFRKWLWGILTGVILTIVIYFIIKNKTKCLTLIKAMLRN